MPILKQIIVVEENGNKVVAKFRFDKPFKTQNQAEKFFRDFRDSYPERYNTKVTFLPHYRSISKHKND